MDPVRASANFSKFHSIETETETKDEILVDSLTRVQLSCLVTDDDLEASV